MLYKELTSIETTIGSAIDKISGSTGFSFIKLSFISILHFCFFPRTQKKPHNHPSDDCVAKRACIKRES